MTVTQVTKHDGRGVISVTCHISHNHVIEEKDIEDSGINNNMITTC